MRMIPAIVAALFATIAFGQSNCLDPQKAVALDAQWEEALLTSDVDFLKGLLAEDFIWVHNHAGTVDTRVGLIEKTERARARAQSNTKARTQRDVKAMVLGSTCIVSGFTLVDRGPQPTLYNFMRTYAEVDGTCYLLGNHTMAVPPEDD